MVFYLAEVEKATFGAREEVLVTSLPRIDHHLMSRSASSPRDDEEFVLHLKPFVRMTMSTEKYLSFMELKKRAGKVDFNLLAWTDHPAVGERRLVAADNNEINLRVLFEFLKFAQIPLGLFLDLFFG